MSDVPMIAQKAPFPAELVEGKAYFWCACGQSARQPFCDGSHKTTTFVPLKFDAAKAGTAYLCGCKHTRTPPYCDGSHKAL